MSAAPNTVHIMLDLETLSTQPNAAIIALGASRLYSGRTYYQVVNFDSIANDDPESHIDPDTVLWWLQQSERPRKEIYADNNKQPSLVWVLDNFLTMIEAYAKSGQRVLLWGNGAAMDNVILRNAFRRVLGIFDPWPYRNDRCYRTIKALYPELQLDYENDKKHNALEDAKYQARHLEYISDTSGLVLR